MEQPSSLFVFSLSLFLSCLGPISFFLSRSSGLNERRFFFLFVPECSSSLFNRHHFSLSRLLSSFHFVSSAILMMCVCVWVGVHDRRSFFCCCCSCHHHHPPFLSLSLVGRARQPVALICFSLSVRMRVEIPFTSSRTTEACGSIFLSLSLSSVRWLLLLFFLFLLLLSLRCAFVKDCDEMIRSKTYRQRDEIKKFFFSWKSSRVKIQHDAPCTRAREARPPNL